jgi:iron(III) transport system substrate-binding protein
MSEGSSATLSRRHLPSGAIVAIAIAAILLAACSGGTSSSSSAAASVPSSAPASTEAASAAAASALASPSGSITLYTSVTQNTVDAVVKGWSDAHPGVTVDVFRAPTAEVAARIATDIQSGGLKADVLWLTDPLSIQGYADQRLLQAWSPPSANAIDPKYKTDTFFGTRLLNLVMVSGAKVTPTPNDWQDLTSPDYKGALALPDPGFAGSAFAALGYFSQADGYGTAFYQSLKDNGAVQVKAPDDVTTGVAEGRFKAGITLDNSARTAIKKGSPITMTWPSSGAIAIYSPIAAVAASTNQATADSFIDFALSPTGQDLIAGTGWQPMIGSGGPQPGGAEVSPDWKAMFGKQKDLLTAYHAIFGG